MDKLSQFYINLATDTEKMAQFNAGNSQQEVVESRQQMLRDAGIEAGDEIISLNQEQLKDLMAKHLAKDSQEWQNMTRSAGNTNNTNNTNNNIGLIGRRKGH